MNSIPSAAKTGKIIIEADPELLEAIILAIEPALVITHMGRNNRIKLSPDKVRRVLYAHPRRP